MQIPRIISEQPWLFWTTITSGMALIISTISIIIGFLSSKQIRKSSSDLRKFKKIGETIEMQEKKIHLAISEINQLQKKTSILNNQLQKYKEKNIEFQEKLFDLSNQLDQFYSANQSHSSKSSILNYDNSQISNPQKTVDQVQVVLEQYAKLDAEYFSHPNFIPVELTEESKDDRRAINGEPIIEFKATVDKSISIYLVFEFNNKFYLIPNATISKISRLIKLNNDSRIFEMNALSDGFELKIPAGLELIRDNHWKLISKGEFRDQ